MKIVTALFAAAYYAAVAPLPVAADCGVSNFKINDERVLRKQKNEGGEVEEALFEETIEVADAAFDSTVDTTSPAPTPPMAKSGKTPDHGEECALDVLQRAVMFANYLFLVLDEDRNNEVTPGEFVTAFDADDEIAQSELLAAMAIGGKQITFNLKEVATALKQSEGDPITLVELQTVVILYFCNDDVDPFFSLVNRNGLLGSGNKCGDGSDPFLGG